MTDYSHEDVLRGLAEVLAKHGSVTEAAEATGIPKQTLHRWINDTHRDEYERLEREHGKALEDSIVRNARVNADVAGEIERDLLEKARGATGRDVPAALQAVSATRDKNLGKLLALTGRGEDAPKGQNLAEQLQSLANLGVVRLNVSVGIEPPAAESVEGSGEEEPPALPA